jgi:CheY-like chemotaxis protein
MNYKGKNPEKKVTPPKRLLLIDDDPTVHFLFEALMDEVNQPLLHHFKLNGEEALIWLRQCRNEATFPDIIIVDLNMPVMNGLEFIGIYGQEFLADYPDTKVLVLTSSVSSKDKAVIQQFDFICDFITKPLLSEKLARILKD